MYTYFIDLTLFMASDMQKIKSLLRTPCGILVLIVVLSGAVTGFLVYGIPCLYQHCDQMADQDEGKESQSDPALKKMLKIQSAHRQNQDISFLEGTWQSDPMATAEKTSNAGVVLNYQIDATGKGTTKITIANQTQCQTTIEARFLEDGRLSIRDLADAKCDDQSSFKRLTILCQGEGDQTTCEGQYMGQKPFSIILSQPTQQLSTQP